MSISTDIHCNTILVKDAFYERTREVPMGVWAPYPAQWTASTTPPGLGNGTLDAQSALVGSTCFVRIVLTAGTTTSAGAGTYGLTLPYRSSPHRTAFSGYLLQGPKARFYVGAGVLDAVPGTAIQLVLASPSGGTGNLWSATFPSALDPGDVVVIAGAYEIELTVPPTVVGAEP